MRKRDIRKARFDKLARQPFEQCANEDSWITWADFYAQVDEVVTDESYQLEQLASAHSASNDQNRGKR